MKEKKSIKKLLKRIRENKKKVVLATGLTLASMVVVALLVYTISNMYPYAITVDGQPLCYVGSETAANRAIERVTDKFIKKKTTLKLMDTEGRLKIEKADKISEYDNSIVTAQEAAECIIAATKVKKNPLIFTLASSRTKIEPYIPEPNYKKDKNMLAGDSKVIKKGKEGTQKVSTTYITMNGKLVENEITATKILNKGKKATIKKGILGLPDGEDWKTYKGDPVYKDGAELIKTAKSYTGKVRYRLGGANLKTGVSCLGFVKAIYAKYGITLPMSHSGMKASGIGVSYKNAQKGDIICYKSHVGIYVGNGKMVDATSSSGVSVRPVSKSKLVTVRRIVKKK